LRPEAAVFFRPLLIVLLAVSAHGFERPKVGQPAPEIALDLLLPDRPVADATLPALAGKAVVLEFWATWCGPCVEAIPHLNELAAQFKDRPVVFLSVTDEERAVVESFLKKRPIQGWTGIAKRKKLGENYGVEGIPDTFLIDPAGKIAANLFPDQLKPEMIEDLVAGRPVKAPPRPVFVTVKSTPGGPAPLAELILRPSAAGTSSGMSTGLGKLAMQRGQRRWFFSVVYQTPFSRVIGEGVADPARYDLSVSLAGASSATVNSLARDLLCAAFKVKADRETRETDVLVLTAPGGKPAGLTETDGFGGSRLGSGNGKIQMTNGSISSLATVIESVLEKPVVNETGLGGRYDVTLTYESPEGLLDAVRKLGFAIEPARRPIEFLVVTPAR
jgi:uncharacterized protein (TIGR03435 family)